MKKLFLAVALLLAVLYLYRQKVGDIRPSVPAVITQQITEQRIGESVSYLSVFSGFKIGIFAKGIDGARDLEFSSDGTLLVSQTAKGTITALPDKNNDGAVDEVKTVLSGLNNPHGIAFFNGKLLVAEETRVTRYNWDEKNLTATLDKKLFDLPKGGRHFTRSLALKSDGTMYVSIGSTCDVCNEKNEWLGAIIVSDNQGKSPRLFAKGLRNSVFITLNPQTNQLWGTEMGRDWLGDDAPVDEINIIQDGKDYGWPQCFGNRTADTSQSQKGTPCEATEAPIYEIPAHSAPLGLTFINSKQFPPDWQSDLLVAYHGSWNRSTPIGYKIVHLKVNGDKIVSSEDFITGFLQGLQAVARPVDVIFDKDGSLFVSDDKGGNIYKIIKN